MGKTKAAKPSKVKPSKEQLAGAAMQLLHIGMSGAILESVAQFLVEGRAGSSLKTVIEDAERRLNQQAWRKQLEGML